MTVSFIVPHRNRCDLLEPLLTSIRRQQESFSGEIEIMIVDNGSTDGSARLAEELGAKVIALPENEGVSRALNLGIQAASGDFVVLINNDVELSPNWLQRLLAALQDEEAWFATGKLLNFNERGRIDGAGDAVCRGGTAWRLGHGKDDGPAFASARRTYFPSATATLFRRRFFDQVGLYEEAFFAYLEDVDLGFRAAIEDKPGSYVPDAVAFHMSGETAGRWSPQMVEWLTCHQLLLLAKFYPASLLARFGWQILVAQALWLVLAVSRGRTLGWIRGFSRGLRRFRLLRRGSRSLRPRGSRLAAILRSTEGEIARVQQQTQWDTYWRWYFRLAGAPMGAGL
jgi:hypothetical protein